MLILSITLHFLQSNTSRLDSAKFHAFGIRIFRNSVSQSLSEFFDELPLMNLLKAYLTACTANVWRHGRHAFAKFMSLPRHSLRHFAYHSQWKKAHVIYFRSNAGIKCARVISNACHHHHYYLRIQHMILAFSYIISLKRYLFSLFSKSAGFSCR